MKTVVVGLGNPGKKYEQTRHNVGFLVLDAVAAARDMIFNQRKLEHAAVATAADIVLAKPDTFMNESGVSVRQLLRNREGELVVVHDDIDIPIGTVKCSFDRGSGDHNGVQSIINHLGHQRFFRIRIGVRPVHEELLPRIAPPDGFEKFLLSDFTPMETDLLQQGIDRAVTIINELSTRSFDELMNAYN